MSAREPVACSLEGGEIEDREAELRAIFEGRVFDADREEDALRLALRDAPGLGERLARLVELERACCPFLDIAVEREPGRLLVRIGGPPEASGVIDGFHELVSRDSRA